MTEYIITDEELEEWEAGGMCWSEEKDLHRSIRSRPYQNQRDAKELFRKEIAKWKDEDPLFMAYVYGQEAGRKEATEKVLDKTYAKLKQKMQCGGHTMILDMRDVDKVFEELRGEQ
jgi:hypothetical protein